jgi:hypothetical protein
MKTFMKILSYLGLGMTVIPSFYVFAGSISWQTHANVMLGGTILWFVTAPFWMKKD